MWSRWSSVTGTISNQQHVIEMVSCCSNHPKPTTCGRDGQLLLEPSQTNNMWSRWSAVARTILNQQHVVEMVICYSNHLTPTTCGRDRHLLLEPS
ncbi:hypothetical protein RRG08_041202 [Elysia crispata]|uniref:Uncharacterized protein n=1 Tax=Elysia crispata TaxID=231223 RepID=A0AAE1B8E1_9GAST|nr:hypothetical protein RRG08_041202 [Elysia crispata]